MAVNYFIYNGHSSEEFNIKVEKWPNLEVPTRVVEKVSVPGRNGDLLLDTGAFSNVEMEYEIYFNAKKEGFFEISKDILRWLLSSRGYLRLEDSYDPDIYRMALLADQERLKDFMGYMGRTTVKFDCKPQRWLKSGEYEQTLTSGETINNSWMPCYPIFLNGERHPYSQRKFHRYLQQSQQDHRYRLRNAERIHRHRESKLRHSDNGRLPLS